MGSRLFHGCILKPSPKKCARGWMCAGLGGDGRGGHGGCRAPRSCLHLCLPHPARMLPLQTKAPETPSGQRKDKRKGTKNQLQEELLFKQRCPMSSTNFLICRQEYSCSYLGIPVWFGGLFRRGFFSSNLGCFNLVGMGCKLVTWRAGSAPCLWPREGGGCKHRPARASSTHRGNAVVGSPGMSSPLSRRLSLS